MAMHFQTNGETPLNFEKLKKNPKKANLKSIWACLLFILIYISVFYIFNLSPSTLLCTTRFWFIVSNTLILIIATDFGTFFLSEKHDFYEDYVKKNVEMTKAVHSFETATTTTRSVIPNDWDKIDEPNENHVQPQKIVEPREKTIDMLVPHPIVADQREIHSIKEEHVHDEEEEFEKNRKEIVMSFTPKPEHAKSDKSKKLELKRARSNSNKATLMSAESENEERNSLRRTSSERYDEPRYEESNEYSRLSNEELNERVEDFIRRFNRQIRLQALRNRRHDLDLHRI